MISVVIPTHNRADLLPRAIDSVLNQTYKDIEIIIVSDGSTDNTSKIVASYAEKYATIKFIELMPGKGGNVARNIGIESATGEFVAFLDDDDEWLPEKLEKQLTVMMSDDEIVLVYTGVHILYVNEDIEYNTKARIAGNIKKEILLENYIGTTSTVMVRKSVLEKSGLFDVQLKALQDFDLWIRICQYGKIGVIPEEMILYYNYTDSVQVSASTQKYIDAFAHINGKYEAIFNSLTEDEKKIKKHNEFMILANKAMRNGDSELAREYIRKDLKLGLNKKAILLYGLSFMKYKVVLKIRSKL